MQGKEVKYKMKFHNYIGFFLILRDRLIYFSPHFFSKFIFQCEVKLVSLENQYV